ncbi:MAG TPA: Lrp/AsnC family transcriptional regulator [Chloroflexota bacterium]
METERLLDEVGRRILRELQENPRIGYTELGRRVGLTGTGVAERVHRLEEAGIIAGYRLEVDTEKVGLPITVFIRLASTDVKSGRVDSIVNSTPEILECYMVTGDDSYLMKAVVSSVQHLESIISRLLTVGKPTTSIVLSTPISHRIVEPPTPNRQHPEESQFPR